MDTNKLLATLTTEEALKLKPYRDSVGKLTIGIGRNIEDRGISRDEAEYLCRNDISLVVAQLNVNCPWWKTLDDVRQRVLADMCFNMGIGTLLTFKNTLALIQHSDYAAAASAMLDSKWAQQVGQRAIVLASMMHTGLDPVGSKG